MLRKLIAIGALASTSACATITHGSNDTITVNTNPTGASCEIKQGANTIAFINPTPGSMMVPKSKNDLSVFCNKDGYETAAGNLSSEFQAMTFGNIIFGGLIGVAVDAASGAAISRIRQMCKGGPGACEQQVKDADAARQRQLEEIEARRRTARILSA